MMKRILCTMIAVICALVMVTSIAGAKTIKVGAAINLTGPASTWGQFHAKGTQDYLTYVNEII